MTAVLCQARNISQPRPPTALTAWWAARRSPHSCTDPRCSRKSGAGASSGTGHTNSRGDPEQHAARIRRSLLRPEPTRPCIHLQFSSLAILSKLKLARDAAHDGVVLPSTSDMPRPGSIRTLMGVLACTIPWTLAQICSKRLRSDVSQTAGGSQTRDGCKCMVKALGPAAFDMICVSERCLAAAHAVLERSNLKSCQPSSCFCSAWSVSARLVPRLRRSSRALSTTASLNHNGKVSMY